MNHSVWHNDVVAIEHIPREGLRVEIEAGPNERAAIAQRLGTPDILKLKGAFDIQRSAGGVDISAMIEALVRRECVASLELFDEPIAESFDLRFARRSSEREGAEIEIDEETPEPLEGETLDLGEILIQQLSLSMDPYPRKPGAQSLARAYAPEGSISPFADLKTALEKRRT